MKNGIYNFKGLFLTELEQVGNLISRLDNAFCSNKDDSLIWSLIKDEIFSVKRVHKHLVSLRRGSTYIKTFLVRQIWAADLLAKVCFQISEIFSGDFFTKKQTTKVYPEHGHQLLQYDDGRYNAFIFNCAFSKQTWLCFVKGFKVQDRSAESMETWFQKWWGRKWSNSRVYCCWKKSPNAIC